MNRFVPAALVLVSALGLSAEDVASDALVKFVRLLVSSTGQSGFACGSNMSLRFKLESMGLSTAATSKLVWASSEAEVKAMKAANRMVVVPKLEWLKLGGAVAIIQEDGKPVMYLNMANVKASGLTLPDSVIKASKVI
jgi:hypothetical protein